MDARALTFLLALLSGSLVAFACSPPLPAKAAPSCASGEEAVPVSQPLGSTDGSNTRWHCEPRCVAPSQRMTSFVGELGGLKAYEFTCVLPCPLGKHLQRSRRDLDTTIDFTYACVDIAAAPPPVVVEPPAQAEAEDARSDAQLAATRFAEFRKERAEEARALAASCTDPCAQRVQACFQNPRSSGKTCVTALHECEDACRASTVTQGAQHPHPEADL